MTPADGSRAPEPAAGTGRLYRLSDHERSLAINALSDAFSEGRLDAEEFRERMSAASEARLASDLDPLFVDLPGRTPSFLQHGARAHGPRQPARAHTPATGRPGRQPQQFGRRPAGYPNPMVFAPLIVLVMAATNMWFFLPLLFVALGMFTGGGRSSARHTQCGARRRPSGASDHTS